MIWAATMAGFAAGLVHVLSGPDHLAAIAPFAIGRKAGAWRAGLQWGMGHCASVLMIGLLAIFFRELLPLDSISAWAEKLVGLVLVGVGAWAICRLFTAQPREPMKGSFGVGAVHGLAGSSHLLGVIPGLLFANGAATCAYFVTFAVGTIMGMVGFSSALGLLPSRMCRGAMAASSCVAVGLGGYWLIA